MSSTGIISPAASQPLLKPVDAIPLFMGHCDPVTGLPNRTAVTQCLDSTIHSAKKNQTRFTVLFMDIDQMKDINDLYGHRVGDLVLRAVSKRLADGLQGSGLLARIGGDEFLVVLFEAETPAEAAQATGALQAAVAHEPYYIEGHEIYVTTTTGICMYPDGGGTSVDLIRNSGSAMYTGKEMARKNFYFFTHAADPGKYSDVEIALHLRKAIDRDELHLYYQPRVNVATGQIIGAEALIRWTHPQMGRVPPETFIGIAEERGLISEIGEWALNQACLQNRKWQHQGLPAIPVGVNVSASQLVDGKFVDRVSKALQSSGLAPQYLEIELTESVVIRQPDAVIATLRELKCLGLTVALDDFGTGYSSLSCLKRLPLDKLKLDQSFVRELPFEPDNAAIVRAILLMAKALKLKVVAEGVETQPQLDFLREHQCDEVQGYYFGKALPAQEFPRMMID
jgi:diguanylate cyclase (GGDEF)-like protein